VYRSLESLKAVAIVDGCVLLAFFPVFLHKNTNHSEKTDHQQITPSTYRNCTSCSTSWRRYSVCSRTDYKTARSANPRSNMNPYATSPHPLSVLANDRSPDTPGTYESDSGIILRRVRGTPIFVHFSLSHSSFFLSCRCKPTQSNSPIRWYAR
jgi:hypothetical protein